MFNRILVSVFFFFLFFNLNAQVERIDTDRPDQTESAVNMPKKYFQFEFGFGSETTKQRDFDLSHPDFLVKYGISRKVELRLEGGFKTEYLHYIPATKKMTVFQPLEIGTRIALWEQKNCLPKTSFLFHLGFPFTGSEDHAGQNIYPSFRFCFQNTIDRCMGLGYNVGAAWNGYDNKPVWLYTFSPNFTIGKKWYAFVEVFGFVQEHSYPAHNLDGGLAYYISDNLKIDVSGGVGLGDQNPLKNFVSVGFSFRFPVSAASSSH